MLGPPLGDSGGDGPVVNEYSTNDAIMSRGRCHSLGGITLTLALSHQRERGQDPAPDSSRGLVMDRGEWPRLGVRITATDWRCWAAPARPFDGAQGERPLSSGFRLGGRDDGRERAWDETCACGGGEGGRNAKKGVRGQVLDPSRGFGMTGGLGWRWGAVSMYWQNWAAPRSTLRSCAQDERPRPSVWIPALIGAAGMI